MTIPLPEPVNFSDVWLPGKDEFNRQHAVWGYTADQLRAYGEAVRAEERERCAKLCEWLPIGTGLQGKTFAEAIRGEGMGGRMTDGFEAAMEQRAAAIRAGSPGTAPPSEPV